MCVIKRKTNFNNNLKKTILRYKKFVAGNFFFTKIQIASSQYTFEQNKKYFSFKSSFINYKIVREKFSVPSSKL